MKEEPDSLSVPYNFVIRLFFPEIHTEEDSFNFTERSIRSP